MAALKTVENKVRKVALGYPETKEDFPWGESAFKVRNKTFLFMSTHDGGLNLSMKLPQSREFALEYPFTKPTGYNLGKSGWVSARFEAGDEVPVDVLTAWLDESFRAVAPKKLVALLG